MADELAGMADLLTPMVLRVAATLRVVDHVAAGRRTAAEIADAAGADPEALGRLLRHLVTQGILDRDEAGLFVVTGRGEALADDHPGRLRQRIDIDSALGRADLALVALLHSVRTGEAAFPVLHGRGFWEDVDSDPSRRSSFDDAMALDVAAWAPAIVAAYDWGTLGHVVDVGGGDGTLLVALLAAYPDLRGTVVDLPDTAASARRTLAAAGLTDRADAISGSFFDPLPAGADGYVLTAVVHNWAEEPARTILRRCADAATASGRTNARVFVVEKIGTDGVNPNTAVDLTLLAYMAGRERTVDELVALAESAGLRLAEAHPAGAIVILELAAEDT